MPGERWTLGLESEAAHLIPYLDSRRPLVEEIRVLTWLAALLADPYRPGCEDPPDSGVFSTIIPSTPVCAIWTLLPENRTVILALLAPE